MLQFPHLSTSNEIHMGSLELLITESSSRHMPAIGWELSAVLTPGSSVKTGTRGHGDGVGAKGTNEDLGEAELRTSLLRLCPCTTQVCPHHQAQYSDGETEIQVCVHTKSLESCVQLFPTLWTVSCQAPLSMGFSRQEYWNGLSFSFSRGSSQPRD